jgi:hypothetical protein
MPLKKITLKPGVNRENTRYTNENGWYESDKIRFRQGTPEKIGGWQRISANTFVGICRSLWNWVTLAGQNLMGVGTTSKFYIENGGAYYDITPIRAEHTLTNPFATNTATNSGGYTTVTVTDATAGFTDGAYVTFYGSTAVGGVTVLGEYVLTFLTGSTYTISVSGTASSSTTGGGTVYAVYQINPGGASYVPSVGFGAGTWGGGYWGIGTSTPTAVAPIRIWNQVNWGQNLLYGVNGGPLYYWDASIGYDASATAAVVTMTIATPCVVSSGLGLANGTPLTLSTTGALPTGLLPGTVYYVKYLTSGTFNLMSSYVALTAYCTGSGTNTLTVTAVTSGTIAAGMTIYYYYGGSYISLGTVTLTGTGTGGTGTYTVSAGGAIGTAIIPISMSAGTVVNTSGSQSGTQSLSPRGVLVSSLPGADAYVPLYQNVFTVSDASRFVLVFGTNDYDSTTLDPMLIRWSDQESLTTWYPAVTNQAGSVRLSHGSEIVAVLQSRQEILVWTDSTIYSLQYLGPPYVWGNQLLADNVSIISQNAPVLASGVTYWMGVDKFYKYDGRVQTLNCDLRQYIYSDINLNQSVQVFGSTNEGFNEAWWFYCSAESTVIDKYVIYNYIENAWYYGTMGRTAWLDTGLRDYPVAATYSYNLVNHEYGVDDNTTGTPAAIAASITSAQFDLDDGDKFAFVWRMLPDLTFRGSTDGTTPALTMQLLPLQNSGSGYNDPKSVGGTSTDASQAVTATQTYPIDLDTYNGQVYIRIRGRQMSMRITSNQIGTQWQLGSPRIDIRADGRRGN